jgi:Flp pilus assembly pilin Flp
MGLTFGVAASISTDAICGGVLPTGASLRARRSHLGDPRRVNRMAISLQYRSSSGGLMNRRITTFITADDGNDILEYAFLAGLLSLVCFTALNALGGNIKTMFSALATKLTESMP